VKDWKANGNQEQRLNVCRRQWRPVKRTAQGAGHTVAAQFLQHHVPLACAVAVILWGPDASSDKLRAGARCTSCGGAVDRAYDAA
jgi:hypothetical protein